MTYQECKMFQLWSWEPKSLSLGSFVCLCPFVALALGVPFCTQESISYLSPGVPTVAVDCDVNMHLVIFGSALKALVIADNVLTLI